MVLENNHFFKNLPNSVDFGVFPSNGSANIEGQIGCANSDQKIFVFFKASEPSRGSLYAGFLALLKIGTVLQGSPNITLDATEVN